MSSIGTPLGGLKTVTYKGTCAILDDAETKAWFYPALAAALIPGDENFQQGFARYLDSPDRIILRMEPGQRIGYDGVKMVAATADWIAEEGRAQR